MKTLYLLFFIGIFNNFYSQDLVYTFCNETGAATLSLDLERFKEDVIEQYPDIFYKEEAIYISASRSGLIKVTQLSTRPVIEEICMTSVDLRSFYEIGINSNKEFYISGGGATYNTNLFKVSENCEITPVYTNAPIGIQAMSFDKLDNLYIGNSYNSPTIYRADANDLNNFYPWHTFQEGSPSGDFVEKDGFLYIAWSANRTNYLYKITLDADNQFVSYVNLGAIRPATYGLANEYGVLYGVTPTSLYKIDENTMQTTTIINNPSDNSSRAWWGAAGLHEAINTEYQFFENEIDAQNNLNSLSSPYSISTNSNHIIYVRIENTTTGEYFLYPIQININNPPKIELQEVYGACNNELVTIESGLPEDTYSINWYKNDTLIPNEKSPNLQTAEEGKYRITASLPNVSCSSSASTEVKWSQIEITNVEISNNDNVEVMATGNNAPFEYSLDNGPWQFSNTFSQLTNGIHEVVARNSLGCLSNKIIFDIGTSNTITPNNDGINDQYKFPYLQDYTGVTLIIYDKYGKVLQNSSLTYGQTWNGKYLGRSLPTDSYWYVISRENKILYKGYIFIKNY